MDEIIKMITVDLDYLDESELAYSIKIMENYGFNVDMCFDVSPSGKGFHLWGYSLTGMPKRQVMCLRRICQDDYFRVYLDSLPGRMTDVLFDRKEVEIYE